MNALKNQSGFTLIELLMIMGIMGILLAIITINLTKVQRGTSLSAATETVVSDVKSQQLKAVSGASENGATGDSYGVDCSGSNNTYTLFRGSSKAANPTTNQIITLDTSIKIVCNPTSLVFLQKSGELSSSATITLSNTAGTETKTLNVNIYGGIR